MEEDEAVGFALAKIEAGARPAFQAESVRKVVLDLVCRAETGKGVADGPGKLRGEAGKGGRGFGGEGEKGAGFGFRHFFVGRQGWGCGVKVEFGGLPGRGLTQSGGEERADFGEACGQGGRLSDEEGAEIDGLVASESPPNAGPSPPHFVIVLHIIKD